MTAPDDDLEAFAAAGVHPFEDGQPLPVSRPHVVLLEAIAKQRVTVNVLVHLVTTILDVLIDAGLVPEAGRLTPDALEAARAEIQAADAVDATLGVLADALAAGQIEPWPSGVLARAEARWPCGCSHASRDGEETP